MIEEKTAREAVVRIIEMLRMKANALSNMADDALEAAMAAALKVAIDEIALMGIREFGLRAEDFIKNKRLKWPS